MTSVENHGADYDAFVGRLSDTCHRLRELPGRWSADLESQVAVIMADAEPRTLSERIMRTTITRTVGNVHHLQDMLMLLEKPFLAPLLGAGALNVQVLPSGSDYRYATHAGKINIRRVTTRGAPRESWRERGRGARRARGRARRDVSMGDTRGRGGRGRIAYGRGGRRPDQGRAGSMSVADIRGTVERINRATGGGVSLSSSDILTAALTRAEAGVQVQDEWKSPGRESMGTAPAPPAPPAPPAADIPDVMSGLTVSDFLGLTVGAALAAPVLPAMRWADASSDESDASD